MKSSCKNLLPGMYVNAIIEESSKNVTVVPTEAVVSFDDKNYIFTFEKDKEESGYEFTEYRMVEIVKGVTGSGYTEIQLPEGFNTTSSVLLLKGHIICYLQRKTQEKWLAREEYSEPCSLSQSCYQLESYHVLTSVAVIPAAGCCFNTKVPIFKNFNILWLKSH